jgi:CubicO group peptidase (beta-lactamase class C family)
MKVFSQGIISTTALFIFLISFAVAANETEKLDLAGQIELIALEEIKATGIPSLQISIGFGKDIVYEGAFGLADIESEVKATVKSKYRTASIAKWFTAGAASCIEKSCMCMNHRSMV